LHWTVSLEDEAVLAQAIADSDMKLLGDTDRLESLALDLGTSINVRGPLLAFAPPSHPPPRFPFGAGLLMRGTALANHFKKVIDNATCLAILRGKDFNSMKKGLHAAARVGIAAAGGGAPMILPKTMPPPKKPSANESALPCGRPALAGKRTKLLPASTALPAPSLPVAGGRTRTAVLDAMSQEERVAHKKALAAARQRKYTAKNKKLQLEKARLAKLEKSEAAASKKAKYTPVKRKLSNTKGRVSASKRISPRK
jgi:hypothetical protein